MFAMRINHHNPSVSKEVLKKVAGKVAGLATRFRNSVQYLPTTSVLE